MRNIVSLAILLYVSLLCSVQPGHAYDSRLSPLADNPFYAVSPSLSSPMADAISEDNHDHEPGLLSVDVNPLTHSATDTDNNLNYVYDSQLYLSAYARAPPFNPQF
ncbi:hypothetical protein [Rheinheimera salexigens]|uniref:Uncharacterized protein n=1 Tax=Rheinheimera salexigens TaxID=1628148 RepID=A0A1E7Q417_9GAMM|nr:hypothetical protein [Rheinheimera salexigens]OEY68871.1 hypothetical protein BI198_04290 [Rheinheimera salexigens]